MFDPWEVAAFDQARQLGIHRTVHAGEDGPALCVAQVSVHGMLSLRSGT